MSLAIFDLDYTLVEGDCEFLWSQFLLEHGVVDGEFVHQIADYYQDYAAGQLDFGAYETFLMQALKNLNPDALSTLRALFLERVRYRLRPYVLKQLDWHRVQGHTLLLITASNAFLARPVADLLGVQNLICTDVEMKDGRPTGRVIGTIPFREGKVILLETWLSRCEQSLRDSWGYSDSYNDLPLLERVQYPVAVTPDSSLYTHALDHGWDILT